MLLNHRWTNISQNSTTSWHFALSTYKLHTRCNVKRTASRVINYTQTEQLKWLICRINIRQMREYYCGKTFCRVLTLKKLSTRSYIHWGTPCKQKFHPSFRSGTSNIRIYFGRWMSTAEGELTSFLIANVYHLNSQGITKRSVPTSDSSNFFLYNPTAAMWRRSA